MVGMIAEYVALLHEIHLPVAEPARLKGVLAHLEATVALSRSSWRSILAETDNDHEWVPNPQQDTVVPAGRVTDEMVRTWTEFLDEFEAILQGRKLLPFWRGGDSKVGINLRRVFADPRPFDLVFWVQGTAAAPYLETGDVSSKETWGRINRVFQGEFVGFAIWFN